MTAKTFTRYWPWWVAIVWLLGYEAYAVFAPPPTLSEMVWRASAAWPALPFVVLALLAILCLHFWVRRFR
jgi:hypothetical protein